MNKINYLLDEQFVRDYLTRKLLPIYNNFVSIESIEIIPHKKLIWETTYHVVLEFATTFVTKDGDREELPIFCSAHDHESRLDFYKALKFLWQHGFGEGDLSIPHPLFYSHGFNALFYRGVKGENLYFYIKKNDRAEIENIIPKAAFWFAKLHALPVDNKLHFNKVNSRIETVLPGMHHILEKINNEHQQSAQVVSEIYKMMDDQEKKFFSSTEKCWLIHGDAHPENIIRMSKDKIAVIDFSDFCTADLARDLGSFIQQVGYMANRKIGDKDYTKKIQKLFLDNYFNTAGIKLDDNLQDRIDNYYNWTAMRTATYFLIKDGAEPERALPLIKEVADRLKINYSF